MEESNRITHTCKTGGSGGGCSGWRRGGGRASGVVVAIVAYLGRVGATEAGWGKREEETGNAAVVAHMRSAYGH